MTIPVNSDMFTGLELLSSAVIAVDAGEIVCYVNPAAENLFAVSHRQWRGKMLFDVLGRSLVLEKAIASALQSRWSYTGYDMKVQRPFIEPILLDCTVSPIDEAGTGLLLEFRPANIRWRVAREELLLQQQRANRELIRNLAHEIKNPLGGIRGSAQLLERELNDTVLREYTEVIIAEADRLQDLMTRVLTTHGKIHLNPLNVHEVLVRVGKLMQAEFPGIVIDNDFDPSLPEVLADRERLIQAVLNIARNAAQALEGKGKVILRTRIARQVTLAKKFYKLAVELQIIDNGPGVSEEMQEKIFYPLVSGRVGGSGLGLALTQNLVEQHHGVIRLDSHPGETCFTVTLPVTDETR
ncbi:MAG: PAS domain-containing protein [Burkholderiales bacterium]|jgi:two-component system nitrogen regulation sensor histidine kinase GlnL|nr:PAS domain-containing protein [Burkholderiales bacterium]